MFDFEGLRTPLPIDLLPGHSVTVICDIRTPDVPGVYRLQFQAVVEGVRWIDASDLTVTVILDGKPVAHDMFVYTSDDYGYANDHQVGLYLVGDILNTVPGEKRVLEVGGGIHPQSQAIADVDIVAIDISSPMSQLGQLYFDHVQKHNRIAFIVCDANDPPFVEQTFDAVTVFSALHHFADPVRLLSNLKNLLKDGGFIATLCEPCRPSRNDAMYLRDLQKGINEQSWTIDEYVEIFRRAGLRVKSGRVDGGSLKAILVRS